MMLNVKTVFTVFMFKLVETTDRPGEETVLESKNTSLQIKDLTEVKIQKYSQEKELKGSKKSSSYRKVQGDLLLIMSFTVFTYCCNLLMKAENSN